MNLPKKVDNSHLVLDTVCPLRGVLVPFQQQPRLAGQMGDLGGWSVDPCCDRRCRFFIRDGTPDGQCAVHALAVAMLAPQFVTAPAAPAAPAVPSQNGEPA